jgi:hypothetical protein
VYLYDIVNNKLSDSSYAGTSIYGFADGEKIFYFCSESGMGSGDLFVMNMPGFEMKKDFYKEGDPINSCDGFDAKTNGLKYSMGFGADTKNYVYDILNDTVTSAE